MKPADVSGTVTISDQRSYITLYGKKIPQKSTVLLVKFVVEPLYSFSLG